MIHDDGKKESLRSARCPFRYADMWQRFSSAKPFTQYK
jgi:hypothetical protein